MYGIKAVLTLGLLLTAVESRPEGYGGVKGGRNRQSTANAFATAQAMAHADAGYPGVAQSFASAAANSVAADGTSTAATTANAYADGGNIGKVTGSDDANRNANLSGDSDDLRLLSEHSENSENQSNNYKDETSVRGHHNANTGTYENSGNVGVNGQDPDRLQGCGVPTGVKGHQGASGCANNEQIKPSVSNPYPTYNGHPELSAGSKYPTNADGGYGGNNAGDQPCASGGVDCSKNKPSIFNPYPTYNKNPDLPAGSSSLDSGYGGNNAKSEAPMCSSGASRCSGNKGSVSNPHAANPGYTDSSPDLQHAVDIDHVQGEDHSGKPQHTPCFPGDPRCLAGSKPKPMTPNPSTTGIIESGPIPCTSGSINCQKTKPGVVTLYPTHQENPDLSGDSKFPMTPNGGYESKTHTAGENPNSGSSEYHGNSRAPETSNPFLNGEIDVSGIKDSVNHAAGPDIKPNPSNPFLYPHSQGSRPSCKEHSENPNGSDGGSRTAPGYPHGGSSGDSTLPTIKPNPPNPLLSHNGTMKSPNGIQLLTANSGIPQSTNSPDAQGHPATDGGCHGSPSCTSTEPGHLPSSSEYPFTKPNPSNPFLPHNGNVDSPNVVKQPGVSSGIPQNTNSPDAQGHPATDSDCRGSPLCTSIELGHPLSSSEYPFTRPNPSNPFLPHNGNVDSTNGVKQPGSSSGIPQNTNSPGNQGHQPTNGGCHGSSSCAPSEPGHPPSSSGYPVNKPNSSNPFLSHNGNMDSTNGVNQPGSSSGIPQNTNSPGAQGHRPTNGGCHGSSSCAPSEPGHPPTSSGYPVNKPNSSNPFLSHNGNVDSTNGVKQPGVSSGIPQDTNSPGAQDHPAKNSGCHESTSCEPNESKRPISSFEYPVGKLDHSYPLLPHNDKAEKTTGVKYPDLKPPILKNPGSFGEESYDRIDPHRNVHNNYGSQDVPSSYPGKESIGPNPFLGDGQLTNPHSRPDSRETLYSPKPLPGHSIAEWSTTERKPEGVDGYHVNGHPYGEENHGVKTHRPGVKGGSHRREPPAKLQGSSELDESGLLSGNTASAYSSAHASASASAYSSAHASSSSTSGGGQSSAKSEAYSDLGSSGSSHSWASSSASASADALAFASSSSHQGAENWQFPDVTSQ